MSATADKTPAGPSPAAASTSTSNTDEACLSVRRRMPLVLLVSGGLLVIALAVAWWQGRSLRRAQAFPAASEVFGPVLGRAILVCTLDPGRSRNPAADTASVLMSFDRARACANGHTAFAADSQGFTRVAFSSSGRRISVFQLSSDLKRYQRRDFFLERPDYLRLRPIRARQRNAICPPPGAAGPAGPALLALREGADAAKPLVQRPPDRLMSWSCSAQPVRQAGKVAR